MDICFPSFLFLEIFLLKNNKKVFKKERLDTHMDDKEEKSTTDPVSEEIKKKIFKMISTAGVEIEDIVDEVGLEYQTILDLLSEEYLRNDLDHGRRLCCRFS